MLQTEQLILKMLLQVRTEVKGLKLTSKEVLTLNEASAYTDYSKSYLYRLVSNGKIPYSKPNGKAIFFERKVLVNWLLSNPKTVMSKNEIKARQSLRKMK